MAAPSTAAPSTADASPAARLLTWYDTHRRDLPWRRDQDPYRVWVSEVMLQQTRVETVLPYYRRFLERFPHVAALAEAPLEDLLALWSGLGYYRRARLMHAAARRVMEEHGGRFPRSVDGLLGLPGIGSYTAAAVASICFGVDVPVMDGNVERVISRLLALDDADPKATAPRRRLVAAAGDLLDPDRPGDGNQAMMELGATVCTPRSPRCLLCPLREPGPGGPGGWPHAGDGDVDGGGPAPDRYPGCRALTEGDPEAFPPPRRRREPVREHRLFALVERPHPDGENRLLLFRRPDDSPLLAGIWELPWVELPVEPSAAASFDPAKALTERYGATWALGDRQAEIKHGITHRAITIAIHPAKLTNTGEIAEPRNGLEPGWFPRPALATLPLSSMVTKAVSAVD